MEAFHPPSYSGFTSALTQTGLKLSLSGATIQEIALSG